ncbi:MAG: DUF1194 domain-containing protein [Rhodobacteraceae bacterium]|nr:DUF1194 domain-containing protein [Paracoccaceae bacterium]
MRALPAILGFLLLAGPCAAGPCRQALALGLDVSGSVSGPEYRLQLDGLAAALLHPDVVSAVLAMPEAPVRLAVFEWSGPGHQRPLIGWTALSDRAALAAVAARLHRTLRTAAPPGTALGSAMRHGAALLAQQRGCRKRALDISGDGQSNVGPHPRDVRRSLFGEGLTINALAIGADAPRSGGSGPESIQALSGYFLAWVVSGPGAFVETALGFEDFEAAMVRKLLRELESPALSTLQPALPGACPSFACPPVARRPDRFGFVPRHLAPDAAARPAVSSPATFRHARMPADLPAVSAIGPPPARHPVSLPPGRFGACRPGPRIPACRVARAMPPSPGRLRHARAGPVPPQ